MARSNKKYSTKKKSGSDNPRDFDPTNDTPGANISGVPSVVQKYSPAGQKGNSGPGSSPGSDRGNRS